MKFALIIHETEQEFAKRSGPEAGKYWAAWTAYGKALAEAGVMAGGAGLQGPETATTLRLSPSQQVQDGPYAESKEVLGGFYLIDVANLDAALQWASRIPSPGGSVEVRPLLVM
jgi:hypothetical protein